MDFSFTCDMTVVESETQSSWFQRYSRDYLRTLAFSEHEALDHPIACECVLTTFVLADIFLISICFIAKGLLDYLATISIELDHGVLHRHCTFLVFLKWTELFNVVILTGRLICSLGFHEIIGPCV